MFDSLLVICIKKEQPAGWIASTFSHTMIPSRDILEQIVEFLKSNATFWSKTENREYLVEVFIAVCEKKPCENVQRLVSAAISAFPKTKSLVQLQKLASS